VVRATNRGPWYVSRPRWASTGSWLGEGVDPPTEEEGVAGLVELWLRRFGPGTETDLKWWLGSTLGAVRQALAAIGAVLVDLNGKAGYLMEDDLGPANEVAPWGALLPPLDPTVMGWKERDWYLGAYSSLLFDSAGNAGPTIWWDGRIVGGWWQRENGEIVLHLLEDIGREAMTTLEERAARLEAWIGGRRIFLRFPSPLSQQVG
jgi:Winged helix DNA-binding domain